jgi:hypothetical protein
MPLTVGATQQRNFLGNSQAANVLYAAKSDYVHFQWRRFMSLGTILLIVLILLLIGALPTWPYSGGWGYYPSGGLGLVVIIILILLLLGRL